MAETFDCGNNYLEASGFKVLINRKNYPALQFYAQSYQHPDMNLNPTEVGYPRVSRVAYVGESIEFGTLSMDVLMDENMMSYRELYNWVERCVETEHKNPNSLNHDELQFYYDITVTVLTSHNNTNKTFKYVNCFPTSIGAINFTAQDQGEYITYPVTFRFDYFEFL